MNGNFSEDERLSLLLRKSRPGVELPPGFQDAVWRRIDRAAAPTSGLLDQVARLFQVPRLAFAGLALVVLLAGGLGALHGMKAGEHAARDRYLASVDPAFSSR